MQHQCKVLILQLYELWIAEPAFLQCGSCRCDHGWYTPLPGSHCDVVGTYLCGCVRRCVSDRSVRDTCHRHAVGCNHAGECLCQSNWGGPRCETPLIPTGEIHQRKFPFSNNLGEFPDRGVQLLKAMFLVYSESTGDRDSEVVGAPEANTVIDSCGRSKLTRDRRAAPWRRLDRQRAAARGSRLLLHPTERPFLNLLREASVIPKEIKFASLQAALCPDGSKKDVYLVEVALQKQLEAAVSDGAFLHVAAGAAYQSYLRGYAAHSKVVRRLVHVGQLHLGHLAKSFGLKEPPSKLTQQQLKRHATARAVSTRCGGSPWFTNGQAI